MEKSKIRMIEFKDSGYVCPVCKKGNLIEINNELDMGNVNIKFRTKDGIGFKFTCETKNDNLFLCKNDSCRARFERTSWKKGDKKIGPPCPSIKCDGSLDTYKKVPIGKIYPREGSEKVTITYRDSDPLNFKIISGKLSYDEAGICTQCHFVGPKEIDLR